jgi:hypothetical protein
MRDLNTLFPDLFFTTTIFIGLTHIKCWVEQFITEIALKLYAFNHFVFSMS